MIVASLLLILVAVTLLVLGLTGGSSGLLISSIVASLLAAVTLVIGARHAAGLRRSRAESPDAFDPSMPEPGSVESDLRGSDRRDGYMPDLAPSGDVHADHPASDEAERQIVTPPAGEPAADVDGAVDPDGAADPGDEPEPQPVTPSDAVRVAQLDTEVQVVDGRPRYHLADCPHLAGRESEPIGVNEAVELGFSPCGICRPVDRLVAASAHR
jgi:hypothetical protein